MNKDAGVDRAPFYEAAFKMEAAEMISAEATIRNSGCNRSETLSGGTGRTVVQYSSNRPSISITRQCESFQLNG